MTTARPGVRYAEALLKHFGLSRAHLVGLRFAINVALATAIVWNVLQTFGDRNPIWAIAAMVAAADPEPHEARRMFKSRLVNVGVGSLVGFIFVIVGGPRIWTLPAALAAAVLVSSYVIRVKTMWRQAPITAAVVIASALVNDSSTVGIVQGLHKIAEVIFGCVVGVTVSVVMSHVWLIRPSTTEQRAAA